MTRPTEDDFVQHLKQGLDGKCLVCDEDLSGHWTDFNGEIKCFTCGMTYQKIQWKGKKEFLTERGIDKVALPYCPDFIEVPIYRTYWQQTQKQIPLGLYLEPYPNQRQESEDFFRWLSKHCAEYRVEYESYFKWDLMLERYGEQH